MADRHGPVSAGRNEGGGIWGWALLSVAALHLLTAAGTWLDGDHAEMLLMSRRLVAQGTFTLSPAGEPAAELPWRPARADQPMRARFHPGTAVAVAPLLLVDRALGWDAPPHLGLVVHLGGHLYVLGALGLVAAALRRHGASACAAVAAVLLLGTAWPVWQVARHGGAEPVVGLLIALHLWGVAAGSRAASIGALVLLPWTHPTGFVLAPILALGRLAGGAPVGPAAWRETGAALAASIASVVSVLVVWNHLYHGNWWGGGYAAAVPSGLLTRPPASVWLQDYASQCALFVPLLVTLGTAALGGGRRGLRLLATPLALFLGVTLLFSLYSPTLGQDPVRRLAPVWLAWGWLVGRVWDRLELRGATAWGLLTLNLGIGLYWFLLRESTFGAPGGVSYPLVWWLERAVDGAPAWRWLGYPLALGTAGAAAAWRLRGCFGGTATSGSGTEEVNA